MKDERTTLYQEIETLSRAVKPIKEYDSFAGVAWVVYEVPDLHIRLGWQIPLRGFKI